MSIAVLCFIGYILTIRSSNETITRAGTDVVDFVVSSTESELSDDSEFEGLINSTNELLGLEHLEALCGDLASTPTSECLRALKDYWWSQSAGKGIGSAHIRFRIPIHAQVTFGTVFDNPAADLEQTAMALSGPECRVGTGRIDFSLRESCNSDAVVRRALFGMHCWNSVSENPLKGFHQTDPNTGLTFLQTAVRESEERAALKGLDVSQHRRATLERFYRKAFVNTQCHSVDLNLRQRLGRWTDKWEAYIESEIEKSSIDGRKRIAEALSRKSGVLYRTLVKEHWVIEFESLMEFAARLGNEFALIGVMSIVEDPNAAEVLRRDRPDVYFLHSIARARNKRDALIAGAQAMKHAQQAGWILDPEYVIHLACGSIIQGSPCRGAFDEATYRAMASLDGIEQFQELERAYDRRIQSLEH